MTVRVDPQQHEPDALRRLGVSFDDRQVLEIGCGDGRLTRIYAPRARAVVALDPDREAIACARGIGADWPGHVEFIPVGIDAFDPRGRRFDVVLFAWSL